MYHPSELVFWGIYFAFFAFVIWVVFRYLVWPQVKPEDKKEIIQSTQPKHEEETEAQKKVRQEWEAWLKKEYGKAQLLSRSDAEIKEFARKNYKEILAKEGQIIAEWEQRVAGGYVEVLKKYIGGEEIIKWWQEPMKELAEAKRFIAEGGPEKVEREKRLADERTEAEIFKIKLDAEKEAEKRNL
jgi:hypothetical protein